MKFNETEMTQLASSRKPELEGRLQHQSSTNSGFRERFFKLVGNMLFYYRISELSQIENEPTGVIVLENFSVRPDSSLTLPFAFELTFSDEPEKHHVFSTRTEHDMENWIQMLQSSSFRYWKERYDTLTAKLNTISQKNLGVSHLISKKRINPFQPSLFPEFPPPLPPRRSLPTVAPPHAIPTSQQLADDLISL